jgi:hypothetical protein
MKTLEEIVTHLNQPTQDFYIVTVTHPINGVVLNEVFDNLNDAIAYSAGSNVYEQLSIEYGEDVASNPNVAIVMSTRKLNAADAITADRVLVNRLIPFTVRERNDGDD